MGAQFASFRNTNANATYVVNGGGSTTTATSLFYSIAFSNIAGFNQGSVLEQVSVPAGSQLEVQLSTALFETGELPERIYLLAAPSNDLALRRVIGYADARDINGSGIVSLSNIVLNTDDHFALDAAVALPADLTALVNPLPGMRRSVTSTGFVYQYEPLNTENADDINVISYAVGNWVRVSSFIGDITDTASVGGADQTLLAINPLDVVQDLTYPFDGSVGRSVGYWFYNNNSDLIPSGTSIGLQVILNQSAVSGLFKDKLVVRFVGYVDQSTGQLDTSMVNASTQFRWNPQNTTQMALTADLPAGSAAYYEIYLEANLSDFNGDLPAATSLSLNLYQKRLGTSEAPWATLTGDFVTEEAELRRIVPSNGLAVSALPGKAIVDNLSPNSTSPSTLVTGLTANTADQKIITDGTGSVFAEASTYATPSTEAQRGLVGTIAGESLPSNLGSVTLNAAGGIEITVNNPSDPNGIGTVRGNYPDTLLAGYTGDDLIFNAQTLAIYLDDGTNIYEFLSTPALGQPSQTVTISSLAGTTPNLPSPNSDFGLFQPTGSASAVAGSIPAGTYQVYLGYSYDGNQITSISHNVADGNIPTYQNGLSSLLALGDCFGCVENDYQALRDLTNISPWIIVSVKSTGTVSGDQEIWGFDPTGTATDNGTNTLTLTSGSGNWIRLGSNSGGGGGGDMFKAAYDSNDDGVVDSADEIDGIDSAGNDKYYGTDATGTAGFHDLPVSGGGGGSGGHTLQDEGNSLTQRANLNFIGEGVTVTDNSGADTTEVTIPGRVTVLFNGGTIPVQPNLNFTGSGLTVSNEPTLNRTTVTVNENLAGHTIQDNGAGFTQQPNLNFIGAGVTVTNNNASNSTDITINGGSAKHTIQDEGINLISRSNLNFIGADVTVTDNAGSDTTEVTITGVQGPAGNDGVDGTNGTDGRTILNGTVDPVAGDGVDGDFFINVNSNTIFGPKAAGVWPAGVPLEGPQGPAGTVSSASGLILTETTAPSTGTDEVAIFVDNTGQLKQRAENNGAVTDIGSGGGGSGDMTKAVYDSDDDGIVDAAEEATAISGTPGNDEYYGTDATGTKGFYPLPSGGGSGGISFIRQETTPTGDENVIWIIPSTEQWFTYDSVSDTWSEK